MLLFAAMCGLLSLTVSTFFSYIEMNFFSDKSFFFSLFKEQALPHPVPDLHQSHREAAVSFQWFVMSKPSAKQSMYRLNFQENYSDLYQNVCFRTKDICSKAEECWRSETLTQEEEKRPTVKRDLLNVWKKPNIFWATGRQNNFFVRTTKSLWHFSRRQRFVFPTSQPKKRFSLLRLLVWFKTTTTNRQAKEKKPHEKRN